MVTLSSRGWKVETPGWTPPIIACPFASGTMECPLTFLGSFDPKRGEKNEYIRKWKYIYKKIIFLSVQCL